MVSEKTAKKIGLIGSISILVGAVIGIGIFFKNGTVFKSNAGADSFSANGIGVLLSWIIAAIIAFTTALSFAEIGFGKRKGAGLAGSVEAMYGLKFGRFINFNYNFFYIGLLNVTIAIFSAEAIINVFKNSIPSLKSNQIHVGVAFAIGLLLLVIFIFFNYLSLKWATRYSVVSTFIKFLPLIMVGLAGLIFGGANTELSLFNKYNQAPLNFNGILSSLPAILFAFDSFLCVGSIKHEMKDSRRQVSLTIVIGMILCIIFYLFITIGQIMVSKGTAEGVFEAIFGEHTTGSTAFSIVISVFILISILGVLNSLVMAGLRSFEQAVNSKIFIGHWLFSKFDKNKENTKGLFVSTIVYSFWFIVILIPSLVLNTDAYVDGMSNFPTLFMFAIYGLVVLKGIINRARKIKPEQKIKGFLVFAPISVIGCFLAFGYQFFYAFSIQAIINSHQIISWGLFLSNGEVYAWQASLVFFASVIIFCAIPFINDLGLKYFYDNKSKNIIKYINKFNIENQDDVNLISEWKKELIVIRG